MAVLFLSLNEKLQKLKQFSCMSNNWIPQEFAPTNSNLKNVFMLIVLVSTFVLTLLLSQFNKKNVQTVEITKLGIESKNVKPSLFHYFLDLSYIIYMLCSKIPTSWNAFIQCFVYASNYAGEIKVRTQYGEEMIYYNILWDIIVFLPTISYIHCTLNFA